MIRISESIIFKDKRIIDEFNFDGYDMMCFYEGPSLDITECFENIECKVPFYNTLLLGFNNKELEKQYFLKNMNDEELYAYVKEHGYTCKPLFSNILLKEKMLLYGVECKGRM